MYQTELNAHVVLDERRREQDRLMEEARVDALLGPAPAVWRRIGAAIIAAIAVLRGADGHQPTAAPAAAPAVAAQEGACRIGAA